ncbi:MAG: efflux RND transporter periplasmic adaptor subunit [Thermodesulfobacteriota bacterium]|nr:efflux RND transporter periplasmic adaptor subunit [Thermodesulfobacteriota bacterium]
MKKYVVLLLVSFLVSASVGLWSIFAPLKGLTPIHASNHAHDQGGQTLYTCPMHPQIVQESPGQCPICGMDLVPQKSPSQGKEERDRKGAIIIDPVTVQNMGVRVDTVKRGVVHRHVRTFGRVETPDDAYAVVNLKFSGWAESIWADKQGAYVKKGDRLFGVYSPEVFSAQEEYILALKNYGEGHSVTQSARKRLKLWDIPEWQIQKISEERQPRRLITVAAPAPGFIESVAVVEGSRVAAGKDLYRIISLEKVWLKAEVYDFDALWVKEGADVEIDLSIPGLSGYKGKISYIYPTLNFKTRTLTVRVELDNPIMELKPGMIAGMLIYGHSDNERLIIPSESIIHTGKRKIVFVTDRPGRYEPKEVETGLVGDNYVTEVISGLQEGETVVVSGQFLLDSESQLQEAVKKFREAQLQSREIAPGGHMDSHGDEEQAEALYTCPMHPQIVQEAPGQCPICGMDLVRTKE